MVAFFVGCLRRACKVAQTGLEFMIFLLRFLSAGWLMKATTLALRRLLSHMVEKGSSDVCVRASGDEVMDICEPPRGWWELSTSSLDS